MFAIQRNHSKAAHSRSSLTQRLGVAVIPRHRGAPGSAHLGLAASMPTYLSKSFGRLQRSDPSSLNLQDLIPTPLKSPSSAWTPDSVRWGHSANLRKPY